MSTADEKKDLEKNPLPPQEVTITVKDYVKDCPATRVLTNILLIDEQRAQIMVMVTPHLQSLLQQREALMDRALKEQILSDDTAVLLGIPGKRYRCQIEDLEAFERAFPEEYKQIRSTQKKNIDDTHDLAISGLEDSTIPLTLADEKVGKQKVTEFVGYLPQKIMYEVQKRLKGV